MLVAVEVSGAVVDGVLVASVLDTEPDPDGVATPVAEGMQGRAGAGTRGEGAAGAVPLSKGATEAVGKGVWAPWRGAARP